MGRLEDGLRQKKFKSVYQKLNLNLIYTANWFRDLQSQMFKQFRITGQQYNVLRILRGNYPKPYSTSEIRERMLDKMSDTSRIVDRLVVKGLVAKKTCTENKRLVDVVITEEGLNLLDIMETEVNKSEQLFRKLNEQEAHMLNFLLDKLRG